MMQCTATALDVANAVVVAALGETLVGAEDEEVGCHVVVIAVDELISTTEVELTILHGGVAVATVEDAADYSP
jgi:hypothetical protein